MPGGTGPARLHATAPRFPVTVGDPEERDEPACPLRRAVGPLTFSADRTTVTLKGFVSARVPVPSATESRMPSLTPTSVGVPPKAPLATSRSSPRGSVPAEMRQSMEPRAP